MPSSVAAHLSLRFGFAGPVPHGVDRLRIRRGRHRRGGGAAPAGRRRPGAGRRRRRPPHLHHRRPLPAHGGDERNVAEPARASRPFDVDRDGFVLGEGAGFVVLQRPTTPRRPAGRSSAWSPGYGTCADAHHLVAPTPTAPGARAWSWRWPTPASRRPRQPRQRPRHLDPAQRPDRGPRADRPVRRRDAAGHRGEGHHRAPDRRLRRGRGHRHPASLRDGWCRRSPACAPSTPRHARRRAGRAPADRAGLGCPTRSGSAGTTPCSCSAPADADRRVSRSPALDQAAPCPGRRRTAPAPAPRASRAVGAEDLQPEAELAGHARTARSSSRSRPRSPAPHLQVEAAEQQHEGDGSASWWTGATTIRPDVHDLAGRLDDEPQATSVGSGPGGARAGRRTPPSARPIRRRGRRGRRTRRAHAHRRARRGGPTRCSTMASWRSRKASVALVVAPRPPRTGSTPPGHPGDEAIERRRESLRLARLPSDLRPFDSERPTGWR